MNLTNHNSINASYAIAGSGLDLPPNGTTNANGWKIIYDMPQNRQWSVFVLCVS